MKHVISILCFLFASVCHISAQSDAANAMKQINAIKMNTDYISGESTAETEQSAKENARALLEVNIEEWIKANGKNASDAGGYIAKAGNSILELSTTRGNRYRVFLYVKKSDIMTFSDASEIIAAPMQQDAHQTVVSHEPIKDIADKPELTSPKKDVYQPTAEERQILSITSFDDIKSFITNRNNIRDYGKFANIPSSGECYLFVYNRSGQIAAYLQKNDSGYRNVKTGGIDNIDNYKGCGAIWFRYNK